MRYDVGSIALSVSLFIAAGILEIGGGWLVWKWRKDSWHWGFFVLGCAVLIGYGIVPTLQNEVFGRTYAAYGGFFILLSLFWGWIFDGDKPDKWDWLGAVVSVAGVCVIMFVPRPKEEEAIALPPVEAPLAAPLDPAP